MEKTVTFDDEKWQLVPIEPTEEMIEEGIKWVTPEAVYEAMLNAAPKGTL